MATIIAWLSGLIFGAGLILSGMSDPAKVLGFLDLAGAWDPSLAFVMIGAIGVALFPFGWARSQTRNAWLGSPIRLSSEQGIDRSLLAGSAIFGIGWGLAGFCPGPGVLSLGAVYLPGIAFALAMLVGMKLFSWRLGQEPARGRAE